MEGETVKPLKDPERFSALVLRSDGEYSRVYRDEGKYRRDNWTTGGKRSTHITRGDLGVAFTIWESEKSYVQTPISPEFLSMAGQGFYPDAQWLETGEHEIEGEPCTVFLVKTPLPKNSPREHSETREIFYVSQRTHWMRRLETFNTEGIKCLVIDWLEVSFDPIPPGIFEVPEGLDEISLRTGRILRRLG